MVLDPIRLEIFNQILSSIAEEMGELLGRTAFSPNIKERKDYSCAIFNHRGELIAQAAHIPVHLGSMPLSVKSAIKLIDSINEGDIIILNDPYNGGTHLPDVTVIRPVFIGDRLKFFVANRAHHSDIGGITPGSMPLASELIQEGIIIPPVKLYSRGEINRDILSLILANVRNPEERRADLNAQTGTLLYGEKRIKEIVEKYGEDEVDRYLSGLINYTSKMVENLIRKIPQGKRFYFEDFLDNDGISDEPVKISVKIYRKNNKLFFDFTESDHQRRGSVNSVKAVTISAVLYVIRSLLPQGTPTNEGLMKNIEVITRECSVVDACPPSAVSAGNVETSQRIVDVVLGALYQAFPETIPAASQGTMNNIAFGNSSFTFYETIGGGMGASKEHDGESAIHSHMTNTLNTPIEAMELLYPVRIRKYQIRKNSGGKGLKKGADGIIKEIEFLTDVELTLISERRKFQPYGLAGGEGGKRGEQYIIYSNGKKEKLPGKFQKSLEKGEILHIETPGGGGWGGNSISSGGPDLL